MLLTEPSQKTLAEPLQKTLLRGDGRKKNPNFLVKLQLFGKAPVTVAKNPLPLWICQFETKFINYFKGFLHLWKHSNPSKPAIDIIVYQS